MDVNSRIEQLEWAIADYQSQLTEAIEQRDRLAIDAAWGVHGSLHSAIVLIVVLVVFDRIADWDSWPAVLLLGFVLTIADIAVRMWSNAARMKEVDRFYRLPRWGT